MLSGGPQTDRNPNGGGGAQATFKVSILQLSKIEYDAVKIPQALKSVRMEIKSQLSFCLGKCSEPPFSPTKSGATLFLSRKN